MTPSTKPVTRETSALVRDRGRQRPVIATITGSFIELRLKGCRSRESLDLAAAFSIALKARIEFERAAKRKAAGKAPTVRRGRR